MEPLNLTGHFLIAMPAMHDPYFSGTLIYVCEHNEKGSMGVIVNRPTDMNLNTLFEKTELAFDMSGLVNLPVYFGGPIHTDRGFILHQPLGQWRSTLSVNGEIGLTSSRDVLISIGETGMPKDILITLGYAGWSAGQIEQEIAANAWLTTPADSDILFRLPYEERFMAAMNSLGIDPIYLSEDAGHA